MGVVGIAWKEHEGDFWGAEMFYASVCVVVTWLFTCVKISQAETIEATQVPSDWWMNKQTMFTHMAEFYSTLKRKEILQYATTWMKLEDIVLSEKSPSQKDKYFMIPLIWGT